MPSVDSRPNYQRPWPICAAIILFCLSAHKTIAATPALPSMPPPAGLSVDPNTITANKPGTPGPDAVENPHWRAAGCSHCHEPSQGDIVTVPRPNIDAICLDCHDGVKAAAEVHPSGRIFSEHSYAKPPDWPLVDGKLSCLTCHDPNLACRSLSRLPNNPNFLRAPWVGNEKDFCQNCHKSTQYTRLIPHIMVAGSEAIIDLSEETEIDQEMCLFCHARLPDRDLRRRTGDFLLRSSEKTLCQICHPKHVNLANPSHMGLEIPAAMQAYIYARELLGPTAKINSKFLARLKASGARPTRRVPDIKGKMTCSTCHNQHQEDVFPSDSDLAQSAIRLVGPQKVKSPSTDREKMCVICH